MQHITYLRNASYDLSHNAEIKAKCTQLQYQVIIHIEFVGPPLSGSIFHYTHLTFRLINFIAARSCNYIPQLPQRASYLLRKCQNLVIKSYVLKCRKINLDRVMTANYSLVATLNYFKHNFRRLAIVNLALKRDFFYYFYATKMHGALNY